MSIFLVSLWFYQPAFWIISDIGIARMHFTWTLMVCNPSSFDRYWFSEEVISKILNFQIKIILAMSHVALCKLTMNDSAKRLG